MMLRMAGFMLKKLGYPSVTASSGQEGLEKLREHSPALTLLDVEMPDMDGMAVLKAIRAEEDLKSSKVCLMTGTLTEELRSRAEALGVACCLSKPLKADELQAALDALSDLV